MRSTLLQNRATEAGLTTECTGRIISSSKTNMVVAALVSGISFYRNHNTRCIFQVLQAPPPPPGLPRAAASRRKKTDARDLVSAPQARARDRMVEALMISQKTRQAPPLLHLNSPWRAPQV